MQADATWECRVSKAVILVRILVGWDAPHTAARGEFLCAVEMNATTN